MSEKNKSGGMGGGLVPGSYPAAESMRPTLSGESWSVVAGHPRVTMVAAEIFQAGGNAVDAGVAAGLASNVVQVDMCNLGGIAPILIRPAKSQSCFSIAGIGRWSKGLLLQQLLDRYGGTLPLDGAPAIVPGAVAGWLRALAEYGTMSLAEVAAPAIKLAKHGFLLDQRAAESLEITGRNYSRWPSSMAVYQPAGVPLTAGSRLVQSALAGLLERLVAAEAKAAGDRKSALAAAHQAFYEGEVAHEIVSWVKQNGGYLEPTDLANFQAEITEAPSLRVGDWNFAATDSYTQGPVALQILGLIQQTTGSWHEIVEAVTLAFNDREDFFAAPDQMTRSLSEFLNPDYLSTQLAKISDQALAGRPNSAAMPEIASSTTSIVTMESSGCSFASSPSDTLDGGPIIPSLGILCSPRGVQSRLVANHPNAMRPGGRPMVTPAALIGINGDEAWALACPGGDVIVQAMAQVAWRVLNQKLTLQQAVEAPRIAAFNAPSAFHPHPSADRFVFAERRIADSEIAKLENHGHTVQKWPDFEFDAGSVQTIMSQRNEDGERVLLAGADPRRSAYALSI